MRVKDLVGACYLEEEVRSVDRCFFFLTFLAEFLIATSETRCILRYAVGIEYKWFLW